uniref:Ovule protein n=1 Tax=Ascaris lumbricoides TaxID=6252 RepID=A0A0M3IVC5_ASCLU
MYSPIGHHRRNSSQLPHFHSTMTPVTFEILELLQSYSAMYLSIEELRIQNRRTILKMILNSTTYSSLIV